MTREKIERRRKYSVISQLSQGAWVDASLTYNYKYKDKLYKCLKYKPVKQRQMFLIVWQAVAKDVAWLVRQTWNTAEINYTQLSEMIPQKLHFSKPYLAFS